MKLKDIRVRNLQLLASMHGRRFVQDKAGFKDTNHFNQLYKGHGSFGETMAERFETTLGLADAWMSMPHYALWKDDNLVVTTEEFDSQLSELTSSVRLLPEGEQRNNIMKAIQALSSL